MDNLCESGAGHRYIMKLSPKKKKPQPNNKIWLTYSLSISANEKPGQLLNSQQLGYTATASASLAACYKQHQQYLPLYAGGSNASAA